MKFIDGFFYHIGRYIFVVPFIIIVIVIISKFTSPAKQTVQNSEIISPTISALGEKKENVQEVTTSAQLNQKSLDLIGPWYCPYSDQTATVSAYISDHRVRADIQSAGVITHFVYVSDCYYMWQDGDTNGESMCGLQQVISMVEPLLQSGLIKVSQLGGLAQQYIKTSTTSVGDVTKYVQNCSIKPAKEELFRYPSTVKFQKK